MADAAASTPPAPAAPVTETPSAGLSSGQVAERRSRAAGLAASGQPVLALARTTGSLDGPALPPGLRAVAFIVLAERLRSDTPRPSPTSPPKA